MSASWVSIDLMDFAVQTESAVQSPEAALKWLRSFRDTLLMGGRNVHPMPWAVELMRLADLKIVKKTVARMEGHARKMGGEGCNVETECEKRYGSRYIELKKKLSADATTREDVEFKSDSGDAGNLESATSADTLPTANEGTKKHSHGEFNNVMLTTDEYTKWIMSGEDADALLEELSSYLASSGKKYKNHYATLLNWRRRKSKEKKDAPKSFAQQDAERREYQLTHSILDKVAL